MQNRHDIPLSDSTGINYPVKVKKTFLFNTIQVILIVSFALLIVNCGKDNPDDPDKKPPVTKLRCEKENFGFIYYDNRMDKTANFYNTKNVVDPLAVLIPFSTKMIEYDTGWFYYKLEFPGCSIHDYYGGFHITTCDTLTFMIYGNGQPEIIY